MICLGIESTAHTFGVGIITEKGKILANVKSAYTTKEGGIHPSLARDHHEEVAESIIQQAIQQANIKEQDINLISFSQGPGLSPCLVVGKEHARDLAKRLKLPLVGVNHCIAHLEIGKLLTKAKDPVLLYASGANTQIIAYDNKKYRVFGETLDNGIGNFLDRVARNMGFGFPGGPKIAALAKKSKKYIELPYIIKGMDVSFGGIQTNIQQKLKNGFKKEDLAFSIQETVFAMLVEASERAMAHTAKRELLLGGGVACNERLQEMCDIMCKERKAKSYVPENQFLTDNGLMIAWQGILQQKQATKTYKQDIRPRERTDDIEVSWKS
ncbi:MAG: bifunctional N(6)-L-threonylcarbamoyladenine synthase/serine/threonine protein kinase [Nanoarchaeota archaeon]|nr:bifunctional N(6)-L-threonylcarbamoyladenine synthase/serine/threonine protein kinase [Nanoarchaeota archaeon]